MAFVREKREHLRHEYFAEVKVGGPGAGVEHLDGRVMNLSEGGCLLRFRETTKFLPETSVEISLKGDDVTFRAMGVVRRWSENGRMIGISFVGLTDQGMADLKETIRILELRSGMFRAPGRSGVSGEA